MTDKQKFIIASILYLLSNILIISYAQANAKDDFKAHALQAQVIELFTGVPASIQLAQAYCETNFGAAKVIGTEFNNVFAIMDFDGDYWEFGNGQALGCWGRKMYTWRRYVHPIISWIDHAYFFTVHAKQQLGKPWHFWCDYPPKYSSHRKYWSKIRKTIIKYNLNKYDIYGTQI